MAYQLVPISDCVEKIITWNPIKSIDSTLIKYIDLSAVDKNQKVIDADLVSNIAAINAPSRARQIVKTGDVLVSTVRPNLNGVAVVSCEFDGAIASTGYCVLRTKSKLDSNYLYYWVCSTSFINDMVHKATGASYPAVSDKIIMDSKIPLPPLPIQKQIAAILEKADNLRKQCQQVEQELNALAQSVFLEMFGDPVSNPKGWQICKFDELGVWGSGSTPPRRKPHYFEGNLDWYSAGELNHRYVEESNEKINDAAIAETSAKIFKKGSILLGMYDTAAFKASILKKDSSSNQACANLNPNQLLNIEWFYDFILIAKASYLRLRRGVRQKNLNLGMIKEFKLPLPTRKSQDKFESAIYKLNFARDKNSRINYEANKLFNSLLQKAFAGELNLKSVQAGYKEEIQETLNV